MRANERKWPYSTQGKQKNTCKNAKTGKTMLEWKESFRRNTCFLRFVVQKAQKKRPRFLTGEKKHKLLTRIVHSKRWAFFDKIYNTKKEGSEDDVCSKPVFANCLVMFAFGIRHVFYDGVCGGRRPARRSRRAGCKYICADNRKTAANRISV